VQKGTADIPTMLRAYAEESLSTITPCSNGPQLDESREDPQRARFAACAAVMGGGGATVMGSGGTAVMGSGGAVMGGGDCAAVMGSGGRRRNGQ